MAAIPEAPGARCAPRGVMRALSRALVLGGLVVAGWLLGSGIGLANEDLGQPGTGLVQLASDPGARAAQFDGGSGGQLTVPPMLTVPPTVTPAVTRALSAVSVPRRSVRPPVKLGFLRPIVNAVDVPRPLAHALASVSRPARYGAHVRSQTPAGEPTTVPPAESTVQPAAAPAALPTSRVATVLTTVHHALPAVAVRGCAVEPLAGQSALGDHPAAPIPASPPGSTTSPCVIGTTGSGAGTKSAPDVAGNDGWATVDLVPMHRLRYLGAGDLPRSPAAQPTTSPD